MSKPKKPTKKQLQVEITIRNSIRFDKLCPACGGPLEIDRTNKCWKCDVQVIARTQINFIENATMSLTNELGIQHPPKPHNVRPHKITKRKPAKKRKTTTKKSTPKRKK